jgi:hypothetical protein
VASVYLLWPRWAATPATQSSWAVTLPALAIGTVVFAGLAWALRLVKRSDLQMLSALIRRKA